MFLRENHISSRNNWIIFSSPCNKWYSVCLSGMDTYRKEPWHVKSQELYTLTRMKQAKVLPPIRLTKAALIHYTHNCGGH